MRTIAGLFFFLSLNFSLISSSVVAQNSDLKGLWKNMNPGAPDITKLLIKGDEAFPTIKAWRRAFPQTLFLGEILDLESQVSTIVATSQGRDIVKELRILPFTENIIRVDSFKRNFDLIRNTDFIRTEYFKRVPQHLRPDLVIHKKSSSCSCISNKLRDRRFYCQPRVRRNYKVRRFGKRVIDPTNKFGGFRLFTSGEETELSQKANY